jgi:hypothetical protein
MITGTQRTTMSKTTRRPPIPVPVTYRDCFKHYTYDQDKVCTPEETIAKFKQKLAEVKLDILTDVRRVDTGRLGIPVYFSVCGKEAFEASPSSARGLLYSGVTTEAEAKRIYESSK